MTIEQSFFNEWRNLYAAEEKIKNSRRPVGVHISTITDGCYRKGILAYAQAKKKQYGLGKYIMFASGNIHEKKLAKMLPNFKDFELIAHNESITEGLPEGMCGEFDLIVRQKSTKLNGLLEIKTAMPNQFTTYMNTLPKENHILQNSLYYKALQVMKYDVPIHWAAILYIDKSGQNLPVWKTHEVLPDAYIYAVQDKAIGYKKAFDLDAKNLPPMIDQDIKFKPTGKVFCKNHWLCGGYCDYVGFSCKGYPELFDKQKVIGQMVDDVFKVNDKYASYVSLFGDAVTTAWDNILIEDHKEVKE